MIIALIFVQATKDQSLAIRSCQQQTCTKQPAQGFQYMQDPVPFHNGCAAAPMPTPQPFADAGHHAANKLPAVQTCPPCSADSKLTTMCPQRVAAPLSRDPLHLQLNILRPCHNALGLPGSSRCLISCIWLNKEHDAGRLMPVALYPEDLGFIANWVVGQVSLLLGSVEYVGYRG